MKVKDICDKVSRFTPVDVFAQGVNDMLAISCSPEFIAQRFGELEVVEIRTGRPIWRDDTPSLVLVVA